LVVIVPPANATVSLEPALKMELNRTSSTTGKAMPSTTVRRVLNAVSSP
jgi:hypothetical protein